MIKVGFLGGRPENGTELPRTEKKYGVNLNVY